MKIRREYQLTVRLGGKTREFRYQQATAYETMRFMEEVKNEDFNLVIWLYEFLNGVCETERPFWRKNNVSHSEFAKYVLDFEKIFKTIQDTYFFWSFAKSRENAEEIEDSMPFDAYLALLSEKLNVDPLTMLKTYTFEQISEMGKGVVYVLNMQTEEWRKKNDRAKLEEKMKGVDRSAVSDTLAKIEEWRSRHFAGQGAQGGSFTR